MGEPIGKAIQAKYNRAMHFSFFKRESIFLPVLLLLGLGLRLFNLDGASLWIDEIYSLMVANVHLTPDKLDSGIHTADYFYQHHLAWQPMDLGALLEVLRINVHMPLYYLLLNPWLHWFGNDAVGLRSFSAVCSTLMLLPVYWLGKTLGNGSQQSGLACLLVAMLAPFQIYYGQEGRMYALSLFWAALSGLSFWKTLYDSKPARWSLLYALSLAGGLLSHYMFVFFLGFQGLYGLIWLLKYRDFKRLPWLGISVAVILAIVWLWAPVYKIQQQGVSEEYHFAKGLMNGARYATALVWQPLITITGDNLLERVFYLPVTVFLFLSFLFKPKQSTESRVRFRVECFLLLWIFAPLLLQIGYDFLKHTHTSIIDRYAMLISPAMCLWLGLSLNRLWEAAQSSKPQGAWGSIAKLSPKLLVGIMAILAVCNVWPSSPFRDEHNKDKDIRGKLSYMAQQAQPEDVVFTNGAWGAALIAAYYLRLERPNQPMLYWVSPYRHERQPLPKAAVFYPYQRAWLFRYRSNNERGLQQAKEYLQSLYPELSTPWDWFLYTRRQPCLKAF